MIETLLGMTYALALIAGSPVCDAAQPLEASIESSSANVSDLRAALAAQQMEAVINAINCEKSHGRAHQAVTALIEGLHSPDDEVRWLAARVMGRLGKEGVEAIPHLVEATKDPDTMVRWSAADALRELAPRTPAGIDILLGGLEDSDPMVRWTACKAVANVGPTARRAAPILVHLLQDESLMVRREAARTLKAVSTHVTTVGMNAEK